MKFERSSNENDTVTFTYNFVTDIEFHDKFCIHLDDHCNRWQPEELLKEFQDKNPAVLHIQDKTCGFDGNKFFVVEVLVAVKHSDQYDKIKEKLYRFIRRKVL